MKVYAGIDPLSGKRHYLTETVPAGPRALAEAKKVRTRLWVPETLLTSRDLLILVEQPAEPVAPLDGVRILRRRLGEWS